MTSKSPLSFYTARTFKVLQNFTSTLADPVFKKRGFYDTRLIHDWANIIGTQWALSTFPEKLSASRRNGMESTLHIRTTSSDAFLLRHIEPQLIERINTYFGRAVVTHLRFIHDPRIPAQTTAKHIPLPVDQPPGENSTPDNMGMKDLPEPLKKALLDLSRSLTQQSKRSLLLPF
jgi:hypothetical protein